MTGSLRRKAHCCLMRRWPPSSSSLLSPTLASASSGSLGPKREVFSHYGSSEI
jgi:hypothetical protein